MKTFLEADRQTKKLCTSVLHRLTVSLRVVSVRTPASVCVCVVAVHILYGCENKHRLL